MLTIQQALNQGVELHRSGNLAGAEQLYRQVLAANPRHADAWHLLGLVAHASGNGQAAVDCISRAIQLDGGQPSFHLHLGEAYRLLRDWSGAEAACRQALRLKDDSVGHNTLGAVLSDQHRFDQAADCYRRAIEIDPRFGMAHANLAVALRASASSTKRPPVAGRRPLVTRATSRPAVSWRRFSANRETSTKRSERCARRPGSSPLRQPSSSTWARCTSCSRAGPKPPHAFAGHWPSRRTMSRRIATSAARWCNSTSRPKRRKNINRPCG